VVLSFTCSIYLVWFCRQPHRWCNGYHASLECGRSRPKNYKLVFVASLLNTQHSWDGLARNRDNVSGELPL